MIFTESSGTPLVISEVAPARTISALSSDPEATSVARNPRASDSIATNTPTVPAIPSTATIVDVHRAFTLRMLYTIGIAISDPPQRVHYAHAHRANSRYQSAHRSHKHRKDQAQRQHCLRQKQRRQQTR